MWKLQGGALAGHLAWLLETKVLAGVDHPVLSLVSPRLLDQGPQLYEELHRAGYTMLMVYMAQQIQQFQRLGQEFAMQHLGTEDEMKQAIRQLFESMAVEERLAGLKPEQLLKALESTQALPDLLASMPPKQRLAGLSPEQRLEGLAPEELERLKELLQQQTRADDTSTPG
jgi:hypothetical protein